MKVLLVDNGTTLLNKLEKLIPFVESVEQAWKLSQADGDAYDLVVLSGSSREQLVGNESDFQNEIDFIRSSNKPLIGICFGCELITVAFGGSLKKLEVPHKGIKQVRLASREHFDLRETISVFENHQWIIDKVPSEFDVIAESAQGPEAIKHKTRPIYGLQFHPENFVDQTQGDELFLDLLSRIHPV